MNETASRARLTVVMPNRNHALYLRDSIGAILRQVRPADEIIIFDDASTDDSVAVLRAFQDGARQIRLIQREARVGVVANLNDGLALASGDYVAFSGADDLIHPEFLARTAALLDAYPAAALAAGCAAIQGRDNRVVGHRPIIWPRKDEGYVSPEAFRELLRRGDNHFLGTVVLYRRKALVAIGGFDPLLGSMCDGVAARRMAARDGFCFTPAVLGLWRNQGGNYSLESATDPQVVATMAARLAEVLSAEPDGLFDPEYASRLEQRVRFGGARLLARTADLSDGGVRKRLEGLGLSGALDRAVIATAARIGDLGRAMLAAWVFLRFRPMALGDVVLSLVRVLSRAATSGRTDELQRNRPLKPTTPPAQGRGLSGAR